MESVQTENKLPEFEDIFVDPSVLNEKELKVLLDAENDLREYKVCKKEKVNDFAEQLRFMTVACSRVKYVVRSMEKRGLDEGKFIQSKFIYHYAKIYKKYIEAMTDAMGNCPDLEIDEEELQERVVITDGLTIKQFEKGEENAEESDQDCDGEEEEKKEEGKEEESKEEAGPRIEDAPPAPSMMMTTDDAPAAPALPAPEGEGQQAQNDLHEIVESSYVTVESILMEFLEKAVSDDKEKKVAPLLIEVFLDLSEFYEFIQQESLMTRYLTRTIEWCEKQVKAGDFSNQDNLASAHFMLSCNMETAKNFPDALKHCKLALEALRQHAIRKLKAEGQAITDDVTVEKLIEPSIFDSESAKVLKEQLKEVQFKLKEDLESGASKEGAELFDKMRKEQKEKEEREKVELEAFMQKPKNEADFKPVVIKSKKRERPETNPFLENIAPAQKVQKVEGNVAEEKTASDQENVAHNN